MIRYSVFDIPRFYISSPACYACYGCTKFKYVIRTLALYLREKRYSFSMLSRVRVIVHWFRQLRSWRQISSVYYYYKELLQKLSPFSLVFDKMSRTANRNDRVSGIKNHV